MLGHDTRGKAHGLLRANRAVRPDLKRQLVVVGDLAHAGVLHRVIHLEYRGIDAVDRQSVQGSLLRSLLVAFRRDITAALVEHKLHDELRAVRQGRNVPIRVQHLDLRILLDAAGSYLALTARFDANGFRGIGIKLCGDAFDVQDDLGNVFLHALDRGELMDYPVDFNAGDCHARQAGKQHTPQAVAQGGTETALQRLHDEFAVTAVCGKAGGIDLGSLNLHHSKTLLSSGRRRHAACQNVRIR